MNPEVVLILFTVSFVAGVDCQEVAEIAQAFATAALRHDHALHRLVHVLVRNRPPLRGAPVLMPLILTFQA